MEDQTSRRHGCFWNTRKIEQRLDDIIIFPDLPPDEDQVKEAACQLRLGPEAYVSGAKEKTMLEQGDMVAIAPGRIALLLTEEKVRIPPDAVGFISLRTRVKVPGLINVSGFHVDPGFEGRLVFTVYNAGTQTCAFIRGQPIFLLWLADLTDAETNKYDGSRWLQNTIAADDIGRLTTAGTSPGELDGRIQGLEIREKIFGTLLLTLLVAVLVIFIRGG